MKLTLLSIEKDGIIRVATEGNITTSDFEAGGKNPLETLARPDLVHHQSPAQHGADGLHRFIGDRLADRLP